MKVKKYVLGMALTATLLAVTVPLSYGACSKGCPIDELNSYSSPCPNSSSSNTVTPDNAVCTKCNKLQDSCDCPKEITTGGAAPICDAEHVMSKQIYAYPNAVYGNSSTTLVGENENGAVISDGLGSSRGVFVQNTDCMTGAAANVIGDNSLDKLKSDNCPCKDDGVMIQSPTSIGVTKRTIEPFKINHNGNVTGAAANLGQAYPDVPDSFWAAPEINHLTDKCIVDGYPDGLFKPNKNITRAELASMVVKGYNLENTTLSPEGDFTDVPKNHWAYEQINQGASTGMISGYSNDTFKPNSNVTRAEAITIMSKGLTCSMDCDKAEDILSKYSDSNKVPSWAKEPIAKAIDNGVLNYNQHGKNLRPNANATRAEVASMLQNMRIAGGYDAKIRTASAPCDEPLKPAKTYVEKESHVEIPTLELTMNDMINSKNANVGDQFAATTINPITIGNNTFPAGSRVNGKITEIVRPEKNTPGAIKLSFNEIVGSDGEKYALPKQVLTARVDNAKHVNGFARLVQWPFTWTGSLIGTIGRTTGGMLIGAGNAAENVLDNFGVGSSELMTGQFKAAGRSYQDSAKALVKAPVDFSRTALSGTLGLFQTTADEVAYLVDAKGQTISQVNPKQKITIAFGK